MKIIFGQLIGDFVPQHYALHRNNDWARLLAYGTGLVNQQLLLQNEYLAAGNRILRAHLPTRLRLTNPQRCTLAEIGKRLGRKALEHVACVAKPDTILGWYRRLIAQKFDGSKCRAYPGRPTVRREVTELVVRMARENPSWAMTGSSEPYPTWTQALRSEVGISSNGTASHRRRSAARTRTGRISSQRTWQFWLVSISLPSKCSHGGVWQRITFCSSFTLRPGV